MMVRYLSMNARYYWLLCVLPILTLNNTNRVQYNVTVCPVRLSTAAMGGNNTAPPFCRWYTWSCEQYKKCSVLPCKCNNGFPLHSRQATKYFVLLSTIASNKCQKCVYVLSP